MNLPQQRRRVLLFLAVVIVPAVVLLATTARLVRQERELNVQRQRQARALLAVQLGQELHRRLELLRLTGEPADIVVARLRDSDGAVIVPWAVPDSLATAQPDAAYDRLMAAAARAEFVDRQYDTAAALYGRAVRAAGGAAAPRADALLVQARALRAGGHGTAAAELYRELAAQPAALYDREGFPYVLYAADALLAGGDSAAARAAVASAADAARLPPTALYAARDLAARLGVEPLHAQLSERTAEAEQVLALAHALPSLLAVAAGRGGAGSVPAWLPYGDAPWLVSVPGGGGGDAVVVVRAAPLLAGIASDGGPLADAAAHARLTTSAAGDMLGAGLADLRAAFPAGYPVSEGAVFGAALLVLMLPLVLGLMLFTAYLLWRDVRREVAAAALRSHFVASVSHELKTPLTSIRMFAEMLRLGHMPAAARDEYLDIVVNESERLTRLINNVLDFSRIERDERTYHRQPIALGDVIGDAARALAYPLAQEGFVLHVDVDDAVPAVEADADAITQAVLNLLSNAMKFSGDSRAIELSLVRQNGAAAIRVTDHGPGIAPHEQRAIFDRYYRSPAAEAAGIPGTGLGLALVAHVAAGHGGTVAVESAAGRGSTFSLLLPLAGAAAAAAGTEEHAR